MIQKVSKCMQCTHWFAVDCSLLPSQKCIFVCRGHLYGVVTQKVQPCSFVFYITSRKKVNSHLSVQSLQKKGGLLLLIRIAAHRLLFSVWVWPLKGQDLHAKIFPESQEIPSSKYWEIFHSLSNVMYSVELNILSSLKSLMHQN